MKIMKDLESRHRIDLETKAAENERIQDSLFEHKRQLEIVKTQFDLFKFESEKESND